MPWTDSENQQYRATKIALTGAFLGSVGLFSSRFFKPGESLKLRPFDLLLLGLTSFRTGRMVAYELVAEPLRQPFTKTVEDSTGAGKTVVAKGSGVHRALGELFSCPICFGTWVAAGLVYGLRLAPRPTRTYMAIIGTTGVAELAYSLTEALGWFGRAARAEAGEVTTRRNHS